MFKTDSEIKMTPEEFVLFRDTIYSHCGIYFSDDMKYLLEKRLSRRLSSLNLSSYNDYYYHLKYGRNTDGNDGYHGYPHDNETYFFPGSLSLKAFTDESCPRFINRKKAWAQLHQDWSAVCSTGGSVYDSLLLREMDELRGWNIEIVGRISASVVLHVARQGVYGRFPSGQRMMPTSTLFQGAGGWFQDQ